MINNQLKTYIAGEQAKGKTLDVIKDELLSAGGWNIDEIVDTFESIKPLTITNIEKLEYKKNDLLKNTKTIVVFQYILIGTILFSVLLLKASTNFDFGSSAQQLYLFITIANLAFVTFIVPIVCIALIPFLIMNIILYIKLRKININKVILIILFIISSLLITGETIVGLQLYKDSFPNHNSSTTKINATSQISSTQNQNEIKLDLSPLINQGMTDPELLNPLKEQFNQPADFYGHYIVGSMSCGTGCESNIVMDKNTGKIFLAGGSDYGDSSHVPKDFKAYSLDSNTISFITEYGSLIETFSFDGTNFNLVSITNLISKNKETPKEYKNSDLGFSFISPYGTISTDKGKLLITKNLVGESFKGNIPNKHGAFYFTGVTPDFSNDSEYDCGQTTLERYNSDANQYGEAKNASGFKYISKKETTELNGDKKIALFKLNNSKFPFLGFCADATVSDADFRQVIDTVSINKS